MKSLKQAELSPSDSWSTSYPRKLHIANGNNQKDLLGLAVTLPVGLRKRHNTEGRSTRCEMCIASNNVYMPVS